MPAALSTLYTTSSDIIQMLGANGLTARIDDMVSASGGISDATNASPIVITTPAAHGLSTGAKVMILGVAGNTAANSEWTITVTGATTFSLDGSSGNAAYTSGGAWFTVSTSNDLTASACNVATARVNNFCLLLYEAADLATSWTVWEWATAIGAHWLCCRRGNPPPASLNNAYLASMDDLVAVKGKQLVIGDIAMRNNIMPTWSSLRVDRRWAINQLRKEAGIRDRTPILNYTPAMDLASQVIEPAEIKSL